MYSGSVTSTLRFCMPSSRCLLRRSPSFHRRYAISSPPNCKKTPLYDFHVAHEAKIVSFAGYYMPIQYGKVGVAESHRFTRTHASIFDVSHMVQHTFQGPTAIRVLETLTPTSVQSLAPFQSRLSAFLWPETGGIVDDAIVTRVGDDRFHIVTNAGCREKDLAHLSKHISRMGGVVAADVWTVEDNGGLVALQGPKSEAILQGIVGDALNLRKLFFGNASVASLTLSGGTKSHPVMISRGGYTGEDGFEISLVIPKGGSGNAQGELTAIVETLLAHGGENIKLAGLGARDSLRLEAGMCLYGQDLNDTITPVEAGMSWIVSPERRATGGFYGAEVILAQLQPKSKGGRGVERRRVGFVVEGAPAREGAEIVSRDTDERLGIITSGIPSPTLAKNIAMGYIRDGFHKVGMEVDVIVRNRKHPATVTKMPFVPAKYYKP